MNIRVRVPDSKSDPNNVANKFATDLMLAFLVPPDDQEGPLPATMQGGTVVGPASGADGHDAYRVQLDEGGEAIFPSNVIQDY